MITVKLKDGSLKQFDGPVSVAEATKSISEGLLRAAICAEVDGALTGLDYIIDKDVSLNILTFNDEQGRSVYRHTTSHILANAVKNLYPDAKLAIGPSIENGFYYDIDFTKTLTIEDLDKIEDEMRAIIKADHKIERFVLSKAEALETLKNEPYKFEIVSELSDDETISFYRQGNFTDMCRGPHLFSTGKVKAFKLTQIAGAYWKGSEKNKMLVRIYGTSFDKKADLESYLTKLEEAKKRDHNKLGRELGIFMTDENVGQGLPLLMPKGAKIMQILQRFVEDEEAKRGYIFTKTPYMAKSDLYKVSGHWDHYKDKMFIIGTEESGEVLALRPMTCPFQYSIYNNGLKSYRDLPLRYSETSTLFRKEASGEMHGLIRVRQFTLSDGHIVCTPSQVEEEFRNALDLAYFLLRTLGLMEDVTFRFSKWDSKDTSKYVGSAEDWENMQSVMKNILDHLNINYTEAEGEAAFYGPKLDVQIKNVYGKEDTIITIQIDFALAERFGMTFIDVDGVKKHPIIIHRSSIGCYERTLALLIEKYAGALPTWMSPQQVSVMSLTDRTASNAIAITKALREAGISAETDNRSEKIGYKIREAQLNKIPYMLIIGDKEAEANLVAVRSRSAGDMGQMTMDAFISHIKQEIADKK